MQCVCVYERLRKIVFMSTKKKDMMEIYASLVEAVKRNFQHHSCIYTQDLKLDFTWVDLREKRKAVKTFHADLSLKVALED